MDLPTQSGRVVLLDLTDSGQQQARALGVVLSAREPESATDNDIFGTKQRRQVGDEWSVNVEAAEGGQFKHLWAQDLPKSGYHDQIRFPGF